MYKIKGSDDREYGPATLEQIQHWIREGRVNSRTPLLGPGATDWKAAAEYPEFNLPPVPPPVAPVAAARPVSTASPIHPSVQERGLAVTSLVLGILSLVCFGLITGIPAIICGHIAHNRARRSPERYGGAGLAVAGFVTGYVGLLMSLLLPALLLPAFAKAKERAQSIHCMNNLKQVGLSFQVWAQDHDDQFPFNVGSKDGGTQEAAHAGSDEF